MFVLQERAREIPPGIDEMPPGPELAKLLAGVDIDRLDGHDRVIVLRALDRLATHYVALRYRTMAAIADSMDGDSGAADEVEVRLESAGAEIGAALKLTRRAAASELSFAWDLHHRLPAVWHALHAGRIDVRRARTLLTGTAHLPEAAARAVVADVIDDAAGLTTGQLHARLSRLCIELHPDEAADRYHRSLEDRRVVMEPNSSGTADLFALELPPQRLAAGMRRINRLARSLSTAEETRSMDQLRADVLLDLLEGTGVATDSGRGTVDIRVDLATLAELADMPGDLGGYGPVVADAARQVAAAQRRAEWRLVVTDPDTGDAVHVGTTRYRPTPGQRRRVESMYPTCVFPGCRMPAGQADLDHRVPFSQDGPTASGNLAPLCRHHHGVRHRHGWSYARLDNGDHRWTSPLRHTYTVSRHPP